MSRSVAAVATCCGCTSHGSWNGEIPYTRWNFDCTLLCKHLHV